MEFEQKIQKRCWQLGTCIIWSKHWYHLSIAIGPIMWTITHDKKLKTEL